MLSNQEKIDMLDINNDPVQVLAVDGNDIKVYGKLYRTVGIDDKLHLPSHGSALTSPKMGLPPFAPRSHLCRP